MEVWNLIKESGALTFKIDDDIVTYNMLIATSFLIQNITNHISTLDFINEGVNVDQRTRKQAF